MNQMPLPLRRPPCVSREQDLRVGRGPVVRVHLAWLDLPILCVCVLFEIADAVALLSHPLVTSAQAEAHAWPGGLRAGAADLVHTTALSRPSIPGGATDAR